MSTPFDSSNLFLGINLKENQKRETNQKIYGQRLPLQHYFIIVKIRTWPKYSITMNEANKNHTGKERMFFDMLM